MFHLLFGQLLTCLVLKSGADLTEAARHKTFGIFRFVARRWHGWLRFASGLSARPTRSFEIRIQQIVRQERSAFASFSIGLLHTAMSPMGHERC